MNARQHVFSSPAVTPPLPPQNGKRHMGAANTLEARTRRYEALCRDFAAIERALSPELKTELDGRLWNIAAEIVG